MLWLHFYLFFTNSLLHQLPPLWLRWLVHLNQSLTFNQTSLDSRTSEEPNIGFQMILWSEFLPQWQLTHLTLLILSGQQTLVLCFSCIGAFQLSGYLVEDGARWKVIKNTQVVDCVVYKHSFLIRLQLDGTIYYWCTHWPRHTTPPARTILQNEINIASLFLRLKTWLVL